MRRLLTTCFILTCFLYTSCQDRDAKLAKQRVLEIHQIQLRTARAVLEVDMTFMGNLQKEISLYETLLRDLDQCDQIHAMVVGAYPAEELTKLQHTTQQWRTNLEKRLASHLEIKERSEKEFADMQAKRQHIPKTYTESERAKLLQAFSNSLEIYRKNGIDTQQVEEAMRKIQEAPTLESQAASPDIGPFSP